MDAGKAKQVCDKLMKIWPGLRVIAYLEMNVGEPMAVINGMTKTYQFAIRMTVADFDRMPYRGIVEAFDTKLSQLQKEKNNGLARR